jgi:hypothetical protein
LLNCDKNTNKCKRKKIKLKESKMKDFSEIEDKYLKKIYKSNNEINWNFIFKDYKFSVEQLREWENKISEKGWKILAEKQKNLNEEFISDNINKLMKNNKYIDNNILKNNQLSENFLIKHYKKFNEESWKVIAKNQNLSLKFIADNKNYLNFNLLKQNPFYNDTYGGLNVKRAFNKKNIDKFVVMMEERDFKESIEKEILNFNEENEEQLINNTNSNENDENIIIEDNKPFLKKKVLENKELETIEKFTNTVKNDMKNIYDEMTNNSTNKENNNLIKKDVSLQLDNGLNSKSLKEISNFADMCVEDYESMYNSMLKMQRGEKVDFEEITSNYNRGLKNIKTLSEMVKVLKKSNEELQKISDDFHHFKKLEEDNQKKDLIENLTVVNNVNKEENGSVSEMQNEYENLLSVKEKMVENVAVLVDNGTEVKEVENSEELLFGKLLNEKENQLREENENLKNIDSSYNKENSIYEDLYKDINIEEKVVEEVIEKVVEKLEDNNVESTIVEDESMNKLLELNNQNKELLEKSAISKEDAKLPPLNLKNSRKEDIKTSNNDNKEVKTSTHKQK